MQEIKSIRLMKKLNVYRKRKYETLHELIKHLIKESKKELEEKILRCNIDYMEKRISFETMNYDIYIKYIDGECFFIKDVDGFYIDSFLIKEKK